jgi:hypothetical protein
LCGSNNDSKVWICSHIWTWKKQTIFLHGNGVIENKECQKDWDVVLYDKSLKWFFSSNTLCTDSLEREWWVWKTMEQKLWIRTLFISSNFVMVFNFWFLQSFFVQVDILMKLWELLNLHSNNVKHHTNTSKATVIY